jgi:hypothetical protein
MGLIGRVPLPRRLRDSASGRVDVHPPGPLPLGTSSRDISPARSRRALGGPRLARHYCVGSLPALGVFPGSEAKPASLASGGDVIAPSSLSSRYALT